MNSITPNPSPSQYKWYYAYLVDDIPQQLPADNANGYTGPFDTEREAWLSLYAEMTSEIEKEKLRADGCEELGHILCDALRPHIIREQEDIYATLQRGFNNNQGGAA